MKVSVKLFAAARELAEAGVVEVELPETATVAQLRGALALQYPALGGLVRHALFAIDAEYAGDSAVVPVQGEIACIPPVSGG